MSKHTGSEIIDVEHCLELTCPLCGSTDIESCSLETVELKQQGKNWTQHIDHRAVAGGRPYTFNISTECIQCHFRATDGFFTDEVEIPELHMFEDTYYIAISLEYAEYTINYGYMFITIDEEDPYFILLYLAWAKSLEEVRNVLLISDCSEEEAEHLKAYREIRAKQLGEKDPEK